MGLGATAFPGLPAGGLRAGAPSALASPLAPCLALSRGAARPRTAMAAAGGLDLRGIAPGHDHRPPALPRRRGRSGLSRSLEQVFLGHVLARLSKTCGTAGAARPGLPTLAAAAKRRQGGRWQAAFCYDEK